MTFRVSYGLAVAVLSLGSGAIASPRELSCAGQEGPGSVSISLDENAGTASLSDDDGLGKTGTSRADFSPTEVHFHDGRTAKFSINWVIERADLTAAEVFTAGSNILVTPFLCEDVTSAFPKRKK